jgi:hypothetical protein
MKPYKDVRDQLKENNYNDFIELEPRDNDLIVQPDMTNDGTSERDKEYVDNNKMETCTQTVQNSESETVQNSESETHMNEETYNDQVEQDTTATSQSNDDDSKLQNIKEVITTRAEKIECEIIKDIKEINGKINTNTPHLFFLEITSRKHSKMPNLIQIHFVHQIQLRHQVHPQPGPTSQQQQILLPHPYMLNNHQQPMIRVNPFNPMMLRNLPPNHPQPMFRLSLH